MSFDLFTTSAIFIIAIEIMVIVYLYLSGTDKQN